MTARGVREVQETCDTARSRAMPASLLPARGADGGVSEVWRHGVSR